MISKEEVERLNEKIEELEDEVLVWKMKYVAAQNKIERLENQLQDVKHSVAKKRKLSTSSDQNVFFGSHMGMGWGKDMENQCIDTGMGMVKDMDNHMHGHGQSYGSPYNLHRHGYYGYGSLQSIAVY